METPPPSQGAGAPTPSLVTALRRVLRPLIRLLLASGVTYPFLANLLKSVYVEVAERDFRIQGKRQSDSRINLLTGVHRKDVKRLRGEGYGDYTAPGNVSLGAQLVARWTGVAEYQEEAGRASAAALAEAGVDRAYLSVDVRDPGSVRAMVASALERFGRIDILVNNAGVATNTPAEEIPDEEWLQVMNVNLNGVFWCCREVGRHMLERGSGA
ncbi:MAG: SDR family NAD(P)-dependent oxidoreductase, partial [Gammaproteobacteria bacterium]